MELLLGPNLNLILFERDDREIKTLGANQCLVDLLILEYMQCVHSDY